MLYLHQKTEKLDLKATSGDPKSAASNWIHISISIISVDLRYHMFVYCVNTCIGLGNTLTLTWNTRIMEYVSHVCH